MNIKFEQNPIPSWEKKKVDLRENVLKFVNKNTVGCEIGVFRGIFSEKICQFISPKKLYLIDPWRKLGNTFNSHDAVKLGKDEYTNNDKLTTEMALKETQFRVNKFKNKTDIIIIEDFFPDCISQIEDPLDWVYLDSSHNYKKTLSELHALNKIMPQDSIILGDDFIANKKHPHHQVTLAVNQFVKETRWYICYAGQYGQYMMRKL